MNYLKIIALVFGSVYNMTNTCIINANSNINANSSNLNLSKVSNYNSDFLYSVYNFELYNHSLYENSYTMANSNLYNSFKNCANNGFANNGFANDGFANDGIINIVTLLFVLCSSLFCSIVFVSNYVYSSMVNQFVTKYNTNRELYEFDPYLFEYLDEFKTMKSCVLTVDFLNSLKYKYLKHNTPKGEIIMNYNHSSCSFDYYCKKSNIIDFTYLDVVSRIYVVKNECKNIYICKCENYDYGLDAEIDDADVCADACADADACTNACSDVVDSCLTNIKEKECSIFYNKSNNKTKANESIKYISNQYKYKGTIEDFYSYCETNKYIIHYIDLLENSDTNSTITFTIDKEVEPLLTDYSNININKTNIGFKEFKKFQKF